MEVSGEHVDEMATFSGAVSGGCPGKSSQTPTDSIKLLSSSFKEIKGHSRSLLEWLLDVCKYFLGAVTSQTPLTDCKLYTDFLLTSAPKSLATSAHIKAASVPYLKHMLVISR